MNIRIQLIFVLAIALFTAVPSWAIACPSCQDAPRAGSSGPDDDSANNPLAYNHSIYIMVGVPYACLSILGFLVYRGVKRNEEFRRAHGWGESAGPASLQAPVA